MRNELRFILACRDQGVRDALCNQARTRRKQIVHASSGSIAPPWFAGSIKFTEIVDAGDPRE
jgi:hypothetical protein